MPDLPYTMEMYRKDLEKMMRNPMATGSPVVPQTQMPNMMDKLRQAATAITGMMSGTTLAGTSVAGTAQ